MGREVGPGQCQIELRLALGIVSGVTKPLGFLVVFGEETLLFPGLGILDVVDASAFEQPIALLIHELHRIVRVAEPCRLVLGRTEGGHRELARGVSEEPAALTVGRFLNPWKPEVAEPQQLQNWLQR